MYLYHNQHKEQTSKNCDAHDVELLPLLRLRFIDASAGRGREEKAEETNRDGENSDKPEDPGPVGKLDKDSTDNQTKD
jgi:hypothetical protein